MMVYDGRSRPRHGHPITMGVCYYCQLTQKCSVPEVHHGRIERPSSFLSFMRRERRTELPVGQKLEDKVLLKLRCDDKYEPLGKHTFEETVNCENGEWSPIPQCEPAKCRRKPPESANATANKENGTHGETVMYTCKPPFQKEVHETIVCEFGQWTGLMPVCKNIDDFDKAEDMSADKKKCFVPKIPHGRIGQRFFLPWRKMDTWREVPVGQILEGEVELNLRCDYKYNPLGKPTIEETVACKDGEWSPIPQCEPAFNKEKDQLVSSSTSVTTVQQSALNTSTGNSCTCMYLSHDTNLVAYVGSKLLQSGSKVENNFKVKFHCNPFGYSLLNGPSEIKCQDCQWDFFVFPKCESRKTGEIVNFSLDFTFFPLIFFANTRYLQISWAKKNGLLHVAIHIVEGMSGMTECALDPLENPIH
ncbi:UNVERIFIED_CONTAM: hypothetical protein NCL1_35567 [Trichonephila clavipes]